MVLEDSTLYNTITANSITQNGGKGIDNDQGGNGELLPPAVADASDTSASGSSLPDCIVKIFSDNEDEGRNFEGTVTADASGNWSIVKPEGWIYPNITATATNLSGDRTLKFACGIDAGLAAMLNARFESFKKK